MRMGYENIALNIVLFSNTVGFVDITDENQL